MKQGRTILLQLTAIFVATEIFFNYIFLKTGDADLPGTVTKTLIFLLFILLFSKRLTWARWILSVSLILYGLLCLLVGFELMAAFYLIGMYYIFFGIFIHTSKLLGPFRKDSFETVEVATDNEKILTNNEHLYPQLVTRYKALFIDGVLILFALMVIMVVVQDSDMRTPIMVSSALIILLTYEPFLTSYSRTVGQRLMRIRVGKNDDPTQKISLINAYIRWFIKGLLGWISFIAIHFNNERRAIHDLASDSIMVNDE